MTNDYHIHQTGPLHLGPTPEVPAAIPPEFRFAVAKPKRKPTLNDVVEVSLPPVLDKVFGLTTPKTPDQAPQYRGQLTVPVRIPYSIASKFNEYDPAELATFPPDFDVRGLRIYEVSDLKAGTQGSTEYHRVRVEGIFGTRGKVAVVMRDLHDKERTIELTRGQGVIMPPFIQHTYKIIEERLEDEPEMTVAPPKASAKVPALVADQPTHPLGARMIVIASTDYDPSNPRTHDTFYIAQTYPTGTVDMWKTLHEQSKD